MNNFSRMTVYDVQHGLAVHVQAPNGKYIIIDLGAGKYGENGTFSPLYLRRNDYIASLIITHPHLDHIDDVLNVNRNSPYLLYYPRFLSRQEILSHADYSTREKFQAYCDLIDDYRNTLSDGNINSIENYGGLKVRIFRDNPFDSNFNNHSCVVVLQYADSKIVVCGDNETDNLSELMEDSDFYRAVRNADVLVAPHHGRASGFNLDFVKLVNPSVSIVSDGRHCDTSANNRYSRYSMGWNVRNSSGYCENRKCLTTNYDGFINVEFGWESGNHPYLQITTGR